jgi:hypothetical protein
MWQKKDALVYFLPPLTHILFLEEYDNEQAELEHSSHPVAEGQVKGEISQTAGDDKMWRAHNAQTRLP